MNTQLNTQSVKEVGAMPFAQPILPVVIEQTARKVFESFTEKMKAALDGREERALKLAVQGHVTFKSGRIFSVRSEEGDHSYLVNLEKSFCTCPDSHKGHACKHRLAAYLIEQSMKTNQEISAPSTIPPKVSEPHLDDGDALEKARIVLQARSQTLRESIIYAVLHTDDQSLQVEILNIEGEVALVRALSIIKDGKLIPQFPFPEKQSSAQVLTQSLSEVRIYR
jgi:hypothetical protein